MRITKAGTECPSKNKIPFSSSPTITIQSPVKCRFPGLQTLGFGMKYHAAVRKILFNHAAKSRQAGVFDAKTGVAFCNFHNFLDLSWRSGMMRREVFH